MKKNLILSIALLSGILAGCGSSENEDNGKQTITLWAWGDEAEVSVFSDLAKEYNKNNQENIYINFVKKPSSSYYSVLETALTGRQAPDLFYVGDSMVKRYAKAGYIEDLTSYIANSSEIDLSDMWSTLMERYQFDVDTLKYNDSAPIYGLPKDIGPTVIYYNEDALVSKGIKVISAYDTDNDGIVNVEGKDYKAVGYDVTNKVFNNKIAMTFDELDALSELLSSGKTIASNHQTKWAFYSSWWFYAGWSVGGDCIQFKESSDDSYNGGYYEFTLDDTNPNYRVLKDCNVNGNNYTTGDFVDYYDCLALASDSNSKETLVNNGSLKALPSIYEMFTYWISYFEKGYSPKPEDISNSLSLFTSQDVAMFVDGRYDTVSFRKDCDFAWDVAPLPRHEDGVSAGHSGSMCLSLAKKCTQKDKAFKVMEYFCGKEGQDALAATGFNVPSQKSLAYDTSKNFLASTERPYNNEIFLDAASYQKGGDWTYLLDDNWITIWSTTLNGDVLNGKKTVSELFSLYKEDTNNYLKTYTKK